MTSKHPRLVARILSHAFVSRTTSPGSHARKGVCRRRHNYDFLCFSLL